MNSQRTLRGRIRTLTWLFIVGLVLSGATAIPLPSEVHWLMKVTGAREWVQVPGSLPAPGWAVWLTRVQDALNQTDQRWPFVFYGGDWLAFGHFAIAIAFVGALRDPVRNRWLYTFGMIACVLVLPYAMVFGAIRGIPIWWRLVDCSFGVFGIIPLWLCRRWVDELEAATASPGLLASRASVGAGRASVLANPNSR
jgi:hypothetical protein